MININLLEKIFDPSIYHILDTNPNYIYICKFGFNQKNAVYIANDYYYNFQKRNRLYKQRKNCLVFKIGGLNNIIIHEKFIKQQLRKITLNYLLND